MTTLHRLGLVMGIVATACCGGSNVDLGAPIPAGHYVGTWTAASLPENGTVDIFVAGDGTVSGSISSSSYSSNGSAVTYLRKDGTADLGGSWTKNGRIFGWDSIGKLRYKPPDLVTGDTQRSVGDGTITVKWNLTLQSS